MTMTTTKPLGIVVFALTGWRGRPAATAQWASGVLSEDRLLGRMRKLTLLDNAMRDFRGAAKAVGPARLTGGSRPLALNVIVDAGPLGEGTNSIWTGLASFSVEVGDQARAKVRARHVRLVYG